MTFLFLNFVNIKKYHLNDIILSWLLVIDMVLFQAFPSFVSSIFKTVKFGGDDEIWDGGGGGQSEAWLDEHGIGLEGAETDGGGGVDSVVSVIAQDILFKNYSIF